VARLEDPRLYLADHANELLVLDEIHRLPGLFGELRGVIDAGRREGKGTERFLLLGSAGIDLLAQSGETLAGRISLVELTPLDLTEVGTGRLDELWVRGGFPDSLLATSVEASLSWRVDFIRTYLERDILQFGKRIPAETLRRLWTMLAHNQGGTLNVSQLARNLELSSPTISHYIDLMVDLLLVRRLPPRVANVGKRLVRTPKVYVRDSGLVHALLGIADKEAVLGHPVVGASWEGMVIENLLSIVGNRALASFYRTAGGAEIDLVLDWPDGRTWAIEIKRSAAPKIERGMRSAMQDLQPERAFVVYAGNERFRLAEDVEAVPLAALCADLMKGGQ
jgi:predicted AAA+ superfamily ATPase